MPISGNPSKDLGTIVAREADHGRFPIAKDFHFLQHSSDLMSIDDEQRIAGTANDEHTRGLQLL
jgi:hypothetical protein